MTNSMHVLALCLALLFPGVLRAADAPDPRDMASRMIDAGAAAVALARIDAMQPKDASARGWLDWERLRVEALARLGRGEELLERAQGWPAAIPGPAAGLRLAAARAAIDAGRGTLARAHLRALLWGSDTSTEEHRAARLLVIESHLAAGALDPAYLAMLRFQLDFRPIAPLEAERFVGALLEKDRLAEAIGWLAQLDPESAEANILRMRAGLLKPEEAADRARDMVRKAPRGDAWDLLLAAAVQAKDALTEVEAREQWVRSAPVAEQRARAAALWQAYAAAARVVMRDAKLAAGDAAALQAHAEQLAGKQPVAARALLGLLAGGAADGAPQRPEARVPLVASLDKAGLGLVALRLFADDDRFSPDALDAGTRRLLGETAIREGRADLALRFLGGLEAAPDATAAEWVLQLLPFRLWAGDSVGVAAAVARLDELEKPLSAAQRRSLADVAVDALRLGDGGSAAALHAILLRGAVGPERDAVLEGLAESRTLLGDHLGAADAWLRIALSPGTRETGPGAVIARARAADSLLRSGRFEDARSLYRWVAKHAGTKSLRESAEQALARMGRHGPR